MELEDLADTVEDELFDDAALGEPFGKSGKRCACHGGILPRHAHPLRFDAELRAFQPIMRALRRYAFDSSSPAIVVSAPCPGMSSVAGSRALARVLKE